LAIDKNSGLLLNIPIHNKEERNEEKTSFNIYSTSFCTGNF
jgi:hypothetical protein